MSLDKPRTERVEAVLAVDPVRAAVGVEFGLLRLTPCVAAPHRSLKVPQRLAQPLRGLKLRGDKRDEQP